jgi:hypothetical protein
MLKILSGDEYICLDSDPTNGFENKVTVILKKHCAWKNIHV